MAANDKIIYIVAGGPKHLIPNSTFCEREGIVWIGVDRGVHYLLEKGIIPDLSVGDFDSVTHSEWEKIKAQSPSVNRYRPEKDETDMELAIIMALKQNPSAIKIFGATGGRLDHFMANALMLVQFQTPKSNVKIEIIDIQNAISVFSPGKYEVELDSQTKYISFLPLTAEVKNITLVGFKYPLANKTVHFGSSLCISNELIQQSGTFSFEKGILMMIRSSD
ncbi:thiamine diphosphokinase [Lederbergia citrea]|uniref:thiamine diphosphokinase n=1 Tax=Lederbergia citrea TaxID=2833581 RepID=UPI001BCA23A4|nr:thiamine diphosphokinase [Lederbergia citrea]MBS4203829.1 thiamine diphosphokinase [Lederbergia citrea]